jgi:dihydroorotate dehydrogenase
MYRLLYRHLLSRLDAELIHDLTVSGLRRVGQVTPARALLGKALLPDTEGLAVSALGMDFAHPLGLAAGFDKNATCIPAMNALGFSFVEVGTVTPQPQPGNPRPRLFRLMDDAAIINRMGFPSAGQEAVCNNLHELRKHCPVGISLGKNKTTPLVAAHQDYCAVLKCLYPYGDFFVVNVSSPNTPGLRELQAREHLDTILHKLKMAIASLANGSQAKPLLVKISPDMAWAEIDTVLELALHHQVSGVVATNTTTARASLQSRYAGEVGGLSGRPLRERSNEIIRYLYRQTGGELCIIGVGGVFSGDDIWDKLRSGATLVQAYTGLIYAGPAFVKKALARLRQRMREEGMDSLSALRPSP